MNELDGPAATMQNVEVASYVSTSSHDEPNVGGAAAEAGLVDLVIRSDVSADDTDDDSAEDVLIKHTDATEDGGPFKLPNFDVVIKCPPDHHYLDTADQVTLFIFFSLSFIYLNTVVNYF